MAIQDLLWKSVIEKFFTYFLDFFLMEYVPLIDKEKGFVFLDKELQKISIENKGKRRFSDKLVKVFLKNGDRVGILVHIEVQGYLEDGFSKRMYINQYRIFDRFQLPTAAFVIYTDNSPSFGPTSYESSIFNTSIKYQFPTYKLREKKLKDFRSSKNPFSIILETAWWGLKKNKLTEEQLYSKKLGLFKRLLKTGITRQEIEQLLDFIKSYTKFETKKLNLKFEKEISKLSKNLNIMTIKEAILEGTRLEGVEQGIDLGIDKTMKVIDLLKEGMTEAVIAKEFNIRLSIIQKIKEKLEK